MPTKTANTTKPITAKRIGITQATYDRLASLFEKKGDTFDVIISRLLDKDKGKPPAGDQG